MPTSACDPRQGRVGAFADHLGIGRFAVLAHWLGSAFALACGPALADRLAVIVVASGMGLLQPGNGSTPAAAPKTRPGGWPAARPAGC